MLSLKRSSVSNSLSEQVFTWLVSEVNSGNLSPGARIPSERDLAAKFSVSRPVIREALSQMRSEGLAVVRKGLGVFVADTDARKSFRIDDTGNWPNSELQSVFEFQCSFEIAATRYAALRRTHEDLDEIRRCMIGMEYDIASKRPTAEHDFEFHSAIFVASKNQHFVRLNQYMDNNVRSFVRQAAANTASRHPDLITKVRAEHLAILRAIEEGDADAAEKAAAEHLRQVAWRLGLQMDWPQAPS